MSKSAVTLTGGSQQQYVKFFVKGSDVFWEIGGHGTTIDGVHPQLINGWLHIGVNKKFYRKKYTVIVKDWFKKICQTSSTY